MEVEEEARRRAKSVRIQARRKVSPRVYKTTVGWKFLERRPRWESNQEETGLSFAI